MSLPVFMVPRLETDVHDLATLARLVAVPMALTRGQATGPGPPASKPPTP